MTTAPSGATSLAKKIQQTNAQFLKYAPPKTDVIQLGTVSNNPTLGPTAPVQWNKVVDVAPEWCDSIVIQAQVPYSLVVPAGATVHISPFFPYNIFAHMFTLAGAPPFPNWLPATPFVLDALTDAAGRDPNGSVPFTAGGTSGASGTAFPNDNGPIAFDTGSTDLVPGSSYTNSGASSQTISGTAKFAYRMKFSRRRDSLVGYIPLGDPENRPQLQMYANTMVGGNPESNAFQDVATAGITCALNGSVSVNAIWKARRLGLTPQGMPEIGQPTVVMGLAIDSNGVPGGTAIPNAGTYAPVTKRQAMLYEKMFAILVNDQQVIEADYFGLWNTAQQTSARSEFDKNAGNFFMYYDKIHEAYNRFLPTGVYLDDLHGGEIPEFPKATPYLGVMSPDVNLANQRGIAPTPAMQQVVRVPSGTSMNGAYVVTFDFGLLPVPY